MTTALHDDAYAAFLAGKAKVDPPTGITAPGPLHAGLKPFQAAIVRWALKRGRALLAEECGLGKTFQELEWGRHVAAHTGGPVLLLAPLAVAQQTVAEGEKFGIPIHYVRHERETPAGASLIVTNYDRLDHFRPESYAGVILDESSIIKSFDGAFRAQVTEGFAATPFRLEATATPAPNDYMELGSHAEFLGVMSRASMLATFFVHDGGETQQWRLKGHAQTDFWRWLCSWAVMLRSPADIGYDATGYDLPPLTVTPHVVGAPVPEGELFAVQAETLQERLRARRESVADRVAKAAALVNASTEPWVCWCNLNDESTALAAAIPGAVEVTGSDDPDVKAARMLGFARGEFRVLVSKPKIAGLGMNWQHCPNMTFVGLSDSWEQYYQAVRRCWRFGQTQPVAVHVITAETEGNVVANIQRKEDDAARMSAAMVEHMQHLNAEALHETDGATREEDAYARDLAHDTAHTPPRWEVALGDCVEVAREMAPDSVGFSVFSPPFASLYTYTNSRRDMGNCDDAAEFFRHFTFLVQELYRVTMPGRLCSVHCMNLPTSKARDGIIGLRDFRGEIIRAYEAAGWIYHSEVCIWKDPVTAMQRTKAIGLLYKQLRKDSALSRQGIPDYLVTFRKPGDNPEPVTKTHDSFPVGLWQQFASPVWMDINPSDTLQYRSAREHADERHIAPLQLEVIRRAIRLWSNPGDLVFSPFTGIGSEGYVALEEGRRFFGAELKRSYWRQAVANLNAARTKADDDLFAELDAIDEDAGTEPVA